MRTHSRKRRFAGSLVVLVFVHGVYQYTYAVLLPGLGL